MKLPVACLLTLAAMLVNDGPAQGQSYPSKPIRIYASNIGGNGDFLARLIGQGISGPLGQPVVVENRGGIFAAEPVSRAPPDGYSLLLNSGTWYLAALMYKVSYDPVKDFAPITIISATPNVLVVHPSLPVKSVKDLIALAKARPGELNYGASAGGGAGFLSAELFKALAHVNIVNIAYKGSGRSVLALLAGEVQLTFNDYVPMEAHVKAGKLKVLAVTSAQPSILFPGMPTVAEALPGYVSVTNTGVFAPAKTPAAIINRLHQEIVRVLKTPESVERILRTGSEVVASTPDELGAWLKADMAQWGKVIKDTGIGSQNSPPP